MPWEAQFASVSLRTLYQDYMPSVYRMAYSYLKNHHDSEDVVQEAFLRLAQSGKRFHDKRQVQAWLIVTAANLSKDLLRRSSRKELPLEQAERVAVPGQQISSLQEAIQSLPNKYKTVIYLHYFEDYSIAEISKLLHRPENTVKTWLRRGRDCLRDSLGEEGGDF